MLKTYRVSVPSYVVCVFESPCFGRGLSFF